MSDYLWNVYATWAPGEHSQLHHAFDTMPLGGDDVQGDITDHIYVRIRELCPRTYPRKRSQ